MLYVSICMIWQWNSFFVETTQATERERGKENEQNEVKKRSRYAERDRVWISDAIEYDNTQIQLMVSAMKWISTRTSSSFFLSFFFSVVQIAAKSWNHRFLCDAYKFDLLRFDLRFFFLFCVSECQVDWVQFYCEWICARLSLVSFLGKVKQKQIERECDCYAGHLVNDIRTSVWTIFALLLPHFMIADSLFPLPYQTIQYPQLWASQRSFAIPIEFRLLHTKHIATLENLIDRNGKKSLHLFHSISFWFPFERFVRLLEFLVHWIVLCFQHCVFLLA